MSFEPVNPAASKRMYDRFHFSQGVKLDDLIVCSGQIGTGADGKLPAAIEDEFRNAWNLVGGVLKEAGLDYSHIVEYTTFHVGLQQHMGAFMKVRDEFLKAPWPAWTAIGITELAIPGAHVEIRVLARSR